MLTVTLTDQEAVGLYVAAAVGLEEAGQHENEVLGTWGTALPDALRGRDVLAAELRSRGLVPAEEGAKT